MFSRDTVFPRYFQTVTGSVYRRSHRNRRPTVSSYLSTVNEAKEEGKLITLSF